ncbi:MAG: GntR family transcriptional regulator [Verrucomicrobiales bacterium]|jgi:GntR family transcriptional regulator|nr:GntR family transcriptional regulator [Verrucomicrobiales bacterium]
MLPFTVSVRLNAPIYEQVIFSVKKAVLSGQLKEGAPFPSVRQLSLELRINPNTAHKVVAALTAEGFLNVKPGIGTVVALPEAANHKEQQQLLQEDLEQLVVKAKHLGVSEEVLLQTLKKHWNKIGDLP